MINDLTTAILKSCDDNKINIISPMIIQEGGKIGLEADYQLNIMREWKGNKYSFSSGMAANIKFSLSKEEAIDELCSKLFELFIGSKLQFVNLVLPKKAVELSGFSIIGNVWIRYLVDYLPASDSIAERWDILVKKVD